MRDHLSFYESSSPTAPISLISIPTDLGSDVRGISKTPEYLREHGLHKMLNTIGADVAEEIEIPCASPADLVAPPLKNLAEVVSVSDYAAKETCAALRNGTTVVAIGGDHSSAIGTIRGASLVHQSLGIIWIDAHPDANTDETSASHNLHGMPAALAMGHGHSQLLGEKRRPIPPEHFLYIGLKDFDDAEIAFLREQKPSIFTMLNIAERGLSPIFAAIKELSHKVEKIWISLDMDSIDRTYAPGVGMPNTSGLTAREIVSIAHYIGKMCNVAGLDLVEILAERDLEHKTAGLALELIARLLGSEYGWYRAYMAQYEEALKVA